MRLIQPQLSFNCSPRSVLDLSMITTTAHIVFWISVFFVFHSYLFYPIIVLGWASLKRDHTLLIQDDLPSISLLLALYNEEKIIIDKLENIRRMDYPPDKIEILIGSDCSSDGTIKLLQSFSLPRARVIDFPSRRGKASVLNDLAAAAKNEILVFSDADTFYRPDALKKMMRHFAYPRVGGVCGNLHLKASTTNSGGMAEAVYWRYENAIKKSEGRIKTTFGATGAIYAIRRNLFSPVATHKIFADDFLIPLNVVRKGFEIRYDADAECWEETAESTTNEFHRKIRIGAANFNGLADILPLLHPRFGFISFGLISHKLIRWIVPFLLIFIFASSLWLSQVGSFYSYFFSAQILFVCLAGIGYILDIRGRPIMLFTMPYYFVIANAGLLVGFVRFLRGTQKSVWNL